MRSLPVRAVLVALLLLFAVACGDDDDGSTNNTVGQTIPTTPTTAAGGTTIRATSTTVPGLQQGVTDGAVCSPQGARGVTSTGIQVICGAGAAANDLRWRPA